MDEIPTEHKIREIIKLYKDMTGRDAIPKDTEPSRTYQWRYAAKFIKNMGDTPWEATKKIAYYAIQYAKENRGKENKGNTIWSRGLWVLTKSNIVDIAYDRHKKNDESASSDLEKLQQSYNYAKSQNFNLTFRNPGGFPNMVSWYESGKISLDYLALSESCRQAMKSLDEIDRHVLPSETDIVNKRVKCLINDEYNNKVKTILKDDYINLTEGERS